MIRERAAVALTVLAATLTGPLDATAHEFWIEPVAGTVAAGGRIEARLVVGRMLEGVEHPYLPERFRRFTLTSGGATTPIEGLAGDLPAVSLGAPDPGLHILAHETIAFRARYDGPALFEQFIAEEGFGADAARRLERDVPDDFAERYIRYAKALVPVGGADAPGTDSALGMTLELVAETLPFEPGARAFAVRLLRDGAPVAGRQLAIFHGTAGGTARKTVLTDAEGRATLPLGGPGFYLVSGVVLDAVDRPPVYWQSLWASLTFRLPG